MAINLRRSKLISKKRKSTDGDPNGYTLVNLREKSEFEGISKDYKRYRSTAANNEEHFIMKHFHNRKDNIYDISNTILRADVIINIAKLKTHKKAGVTLSLKNLIGITGSRQWIPHFRRGSAPFGDEKPRTTLFECFIDECKNIFDYRTIHPILNKIKIILFKFNKLNQNPIIRPITPVSNYVISEGNWIQNNTISQAILDLNKILFYCSKDGIMQKNRQRKSISIIDGIIGGEEEGPLAPTPKKVGLLIAGFDPLVVDVIATKLMGINEKLIPTFKNAIKIETHKFTEINTKKILIKSNVDKQIKLFFNPPEGWNILKKSHD